MLIQYLLHYMNYNAKMGGGAKIYQYHLLFSIKYYHCVYDLFNSEQQKKPR